MAHFSTILNQLTALFPRHEFESLAKSHHKGQKFRSFKRWSQFLAMITAQLSGIKSLRDLIANLQAQGHRIYHLGTCAFIERAWQTHHTLLPRASRPG